jgi:ABC-type transporter Mla subunit MlaD
MNKERRKTLEGALQELRKVKDALEQVKWGEINDLLASAKTAIEETKDEEQEAFDNLSEGLQQAERGQRMEEVDGILDGAMSNLDDILQKVDDNDSFVVAIDDVIAEVEGCLE